jgi:hypothetical protein
MDIIEEKSDEERSSKEGGSQHSDRGSDKSAKTPKHSLQHLPPVPEVDRF